MTTGTSCRISGEMTESAKMRTSRATGPRMLISGPRPRAADSPEAGFGRRRALCLASPTLLTVVWQELVSPRPAELSYRSSGPISWVRCSAAQLDSTAVDDPFVRAEELLASYEEELRLELP